MISLCDLPLSEFASNNWTYGDFAIGLSRDWGIRNGVNPVCYCHKNSFFLNRLLGCFEMQPQLKVVNRILNCCAYLKYVQGPLTTSNKKYKNYRFYDEREVRIVFDSQIEGGKFMLNKEEYELYKKDHGNSLINKFLDFGVADIMYIVTNSTKNLHEARKILSRNNEIGHIVFLTKKQILEDVIGANHNEEDVDGEQKTMGSILNEIAQVSRDLLNASK